MLLRVTAASMSEVRPFASFPFFLGWTILLLSILNYPQTTFALEGQGTQCVRYPGMPGPEDLVLDKWSDTPRILVSSYDRRNEPSKGAIYSIDLQSKTVIELPRTGEPPSLQSSFKPQGLDIVRTTDQGTLLYVVVHDVDVKDKHTSREGVAVYLVQSDRLEYKYIYLDEESLIVSPNDVAATAEGHIVVTNDASTRNRLVQPLEYLFGLKTGNVVTYIGKDERGKDKWAIATGDIALANGVIIDKGQVIASATKDHHGLFTFPLSGATPIRKHHVQAMSGPDNITTAESNDDLIIASHQHPFRFLLHALSPLFKSPSSIFRIKRDSINSDSVEAKLLFSDDGQIISAASTGLLYKNTLFLGQAFGSEVIAVSPYTGEEAVPLSCSVRKQ